MSSEKNLTLFWRAPYGLLSTIVAEAYISKPKDTFHAPLLDAGQILHWKRYVDDPFGAWNGSPQGLDLPLKGLNNCHASNSLILEKGNRKLNYLDLTISLQDVSSLELALSYIVYQKPSFVYSSLNFWQRNQDL